MASIVFSRTVEGSSVELISEETVRRVFNSLSFFSLVIALFSPLVCGQQRCGEGKDNDCHEAWLSLGLAIPNFALSCWFHQVVEDFRFLSALDEPTFIIQTHFIS
jgi:hypothetical protein